MARVTGEQIELEAIRVYLDTGKTPRELEEENSQLRVAASTALCEDDDCQHNRCRILRLALARAEKKGGWA